VDSYALKIKYPIVPDKALYAKFKKGKIDYAELRKECEKHLSSVVNSQSLYDELHRLAYENGTDTVVLLDDMEDEEMSIRVIIGSYLGKAYCGELH
jgi:5S rRNA maturation endonuclease (ribonuclease M5)